MCNINEVIGFKGFEVCETAYFDKKNLCFGSSQTRLTFHIIDTNRAVSKYDNLYHHLEKKSSNEFTKPSYLFD